MIKIKKNTKYLVSILTIFLLVNLILVKNNVNRFEAKDINKELDNNYVSMEKINNTNSSHNVSKTSSSNNVKNTSKKKESRASILSVGDIMFHMPQVYAGYDKVSGAYNFDNNFKYIKPYAEAADLAVANFETVAAGNSMGFTGFPTFNSPVETLDAIKNSGFNIVNLANNHVLDRGSEGLYKTVNNAESRGLKTLGASNPGGNKYLIEIVNDIKIGLLSYSYGFNGLESRYSKENLDNMVNRIDEEKIKKDIKMLKDNKVEFIIVYMHWGVEYQRNPNDYQRDLANKVLSYGADAIIGSHPHVIQGRELSYREGKNKFVIYSMGNFISNQRKEIMKTPYTEDGLMVKLNIIRDINGVTNVESADCIPTWTYKYFKPRVGYEIIPIEDALSGKIQVDNINNIRESLDASLKRTLDSLERK